MRFASTKAQDHAIFVRSHVDKLTKIAYSHKASLACTWYPPEIFIVAPFRIRLYGGRLNDPVFGNDLPAIPGALIQIEPPEFGEPI